MEPKDVRNLGLRVAASGEVEAVTLRIPGEEERAVPARSLILYRHRSAPDAPRGRSDLEAALPHWRNKMALLSAWRIHLERFGTPTMLGAYQKGVTREEQNAVMSALQNMAKGTAVVYPEGVNVRALEAGADGSRGFLEAIEFHNREIARAILGQTLTTDEGRRVGSLALGKVHLQVLLLQLEALRRDLADRVMTEQVVRPLIEMNFGPGPVPKFVFAPASLDAFASGRLD